jgi:hypothetical protein
MVFITPDIIKAKEKYKKERQTQKAEAHKENGNNYERK